uniref:Aminopeptidase N protein n=1 Tax=Toxoplasma gondii TgCATBr9 TaxID=943120 RepID=A0A2T6IQI9_TOXGO|nr:aminopeptidase N protein [Toxoplasma gondii TgCATBr9]
MRVVTESRPQSGRCLGSIDPDIRVTPQVDSCSTDRLKRKPSLSPSRGCYRVFLSIFATVCVTRGMQHAFFCSNADTPEAQFKNAAVHEQRARAAEKAASVATEISVERGDEHVQKKKSSSFYSRENYKPPDFVIESVYLDFDLDETETRVKAALTMYRKPGRPVVNLVLDGDGLIAEKVSVSYERENANEAGNGSKKVSVEATQTFPLSSPDAGNQETRQAYFRSENGSSSPSDKEMISPRPGIAVEKSGSLLICKDILPSESEQRFVVKTQVRIRPQDNSRLSGLYVSDGVLVTHNEAQGFRRITFFLDRPDVMTQWRVRLTARKQDYPVLLSNGELVESGDDPTDPEKHFSVFSDPHKKPSYLFALVAGKLHSVGHDYEKRDKSLVKVSVWSTPENVAKLSWALQSIIRAMKGDEILFGRDYDSNVFHIVCVNGFNAGAMENKGLNIFNCDSLLADPTTTTDEEYRRILRVVAHEYFHNWSGNRVTLRDWTELTLKEGLTVYREQEFMGSQYSSGVARVEDARLVLSQQFREDSGPLAHPVRPDHYASVDNLYSVTVYKKGAEIFRMYATLLGPSAFRKGLNLYFSRYDGQAATCENFRSAMEEASGRNLSQFFLWYTREGTPEVEITGFTFDKTRKQFSFTVTQKPPPMSDYEIRMYGQKAQFLHIPIRVSFINRRTKKPELYMGQRTTVLELRGETQTFTFTDLEEEPLVAPLQSFSAPVKLTVPSQTEEDLAILIGASFDPFTRWNAFQFLALQILKERMATKKKETSGVLSPAFQQGLHFALRDMPLSPAFTALLLTLPSYSRLEQDAPRPLDPDAIISARRSLLRDIYYFHRNALDEAYVATTIPKVDDRERDRQLESAEDPEQWQRRALRSILLEYVTANRDERSAKLALKHFKDARVMTDKIAALHVLVDLPFNKEREEALHLFYEEARGNPQLLTKWFALQARSSLPETLDRIRELEKHPEYKPLVPNFVRALYSTFMHGNPSVFHRRDGAGYELAFVFLQSMDRINPRTASRAATAFLSWKKYDKERQGRARSVLERLANLPGISNDLKDVVDRALAA